MPNQYYYRGRSGEPFVEATVHADRECPNLTDDEPVRPIAGSTVERAEVELCPECTTAGETADLTTAERDVAGMIDLGVCPWCDDYKDDHVGQHASSAHPEEWARYKELQG